MTASEAVEHGIVDKVIASRKGVSELAAVEAGV